mmetsp:Transcript_58393/g.125479  ORF Transcript_58393/g.125479 Transcript_58393/m.125479 type:complete len:94 (+) Transcript_58393:594-875(+)
MIMSACSGPAAPFHKISRNENLGAVAITLLRLFEAVSIKQSGNLKDAATRKTRSRSAKNVDRLVQVGGQHISMNIHWSLGGQTDLGVSINTDM